MKKTVRLNQISFLLLIALLTLSNQSFAQSAIQSIKTPVSSEARFEKVYKILSEEPKWLFEDFACPFDVFPAAETKLNYTRYICDVDAEACLNDCKNNDGNACYPLALLIQKKKGLNQKYSDALFQRACKLGIVSGCTNRAASMFDFEDKKSKECTAKTFEMTCQKDDPWGCTMFGLALNIGSGVPKNPKRALEILSKSCKLKEEHEACVNAKKLIENINNSQPKE